MAIKGRSKLEMGKKTGQLESWPAAMPRVASWGKRTVHLLVFDVAD